MIVAIDTNCLVAWAPTRSGKPDRLRLDHLLSQVAAVGGRIIIPAPVFAEFLVGIDDSAADWLDSLDRRKAIYVAPFDKRAAFECSLLDKAALGLGDKRGGRTDAWQHIKIDRQIVAIARVQQATMLVSNDDGLRSTATTAGLTARRIGELELPESDRQHDLPYDDPAPPAKR